jgi:hypothetical protein
MNAKTDKTDGSIGLSIAAVCYIAPLMILSHEMVPKWATTKVFLNMPLANACAVMAAAGAFMGLMSALDEKQRNIYPRVVLVPGYTLCGVACGICTMLILNSFLTGSDHISKLIFMVVLFVGAAPGLTAACLLRLILRTCRSA